VDTRYLDTMDVSRHKAESKGSFQLYFDNLRSKIEQYEIELQKMYNMDEKGFLIGYLTKSKRVFTRLFLKTRSSLARHRMEQTVDHRYRHHLCRWNLLFTRPNLLRSD